MDIEVVEETIVSSSSSSCVIKRQRTKRRQSPSSPFSSSSGGGESTEEEEDMANCLILLAQGQNNNKKESSKRKIMEPPPPTSRVKDGLYLYQCKTCNRCFSSFQALGGHRASHKKPKAGMVVMEEKEASSALYEGQFNQNSPVTNLPSIKYNNNNKVHECSICGAEFSSGQALGGHMRRHRTTTMNNITADVPKKSRNNLLAFDLNLPAPDEDEEGENKFSFVSRQPSIIFSASPLVDCHY